MIEQDASLRAALEAKESENLKLLHIYNDMAQEADTLLTEFNEALESGKSQSSVSSAAELASDLLLKQLLKPLKPNLPQLENTST
jgi:hypothetical protein